MEKTAYYNPDSKQQPHPSPEYYASQPPPPGFVYPPDEESMDNEEVEGEGVRRYSRADFNNASVRRGFIRKVYSILTVQLFFTLGIVSIFVFSTTVKSFVQRNRWVYMSAIIVFFATYFALMCCETCRRETPRNYVCLAVLTLTLSYMTGALSRYDTEVVFLSIACTAVVTLTLTIFAMQTKIDFTLCSGFLCAATIVVILMSFGLSLVAFVIPGQIRILSIVYAGIAAILFSLYLVYDTQLIMGGRRYEMSPEEYIMAAITLYLDIVMLFTYLLQIIGLAKD